MLGSKRRRMVLVAGVVVIAGTFGWQLTRRPKAVHVVSPERREVVEFVIASGKLRAVRQSDVGAELSGIVDEVTVDEGDVVTAGVVLITLERRDAERQVEQARLAAETADAELERVQSGSLEEDIARAQAQLELADNVGRARTERAFQRLRDLQRGGREEERQRAEAALAEAAAIREQAGRDVKRAQQLVAEGAISQEQADRIETDLERAIAAEQRALQDLALAREPASPEEIAAAEADLTAAQADWQGSVAVARETLKGLRSQPRPEEVRVAEARLREAENALRLAEENLSKRIVRAPITGLITFRQVEPGQSVTPSQRLLTVADMGRTEVYVETDENNLGKLSTSQRAVLISPAYLDEPFEGTLTQIGPEVDYDRGVVGLRITPESLPEFARPDMTVDVNVEVARLGDALAVPETALIETDVHSYVMVAEDGVARRREVRILGRSTEYVAVKGISEDARVVLRATEVEDDQSIRPLRTRS
ncbi:MAG: efflux RND transporter periplasmic adaptor subunit [Armatimonadetes bacterium]|nr:efflux RND transporter periplasmic adaptor subunit [Armatimonadota bacterium]